MEKESYITKEEQAKCRSVADAFSELYEKSDVIAIDAGRFGFVVLQFFNGQTEFNSNTVYNNGKDLFEDLWEIWKDERLMEIVSGTPMEEWDYEEIFGYMPEETQLEIMEKRKYFANKAGISLEEL